MCRAEYRRDDGEPLSAASCGDYTRFHGCLLLADQIRNHGRVTFLSHLDTEEQVIGSCSFERHTDWHRDRFCTLRCFQRILNPSRESVAMFYVGLDKFACDVLRDFERLRASSTLRNQSG